MLQAAGRVALVGLLAAGVIGLVRQRREHSAVRGGRLPAAAAATQLPPPPGRSTTARLAATWLPPRPATRVGRTLAAIWAAPASLLGLLFGVLGGGHPRWDAEHGVLVFEDTGGISRRLLRGIGAGANAIGQVVISTYPQTPARLLAHEAAHARQAERLGPLLLPAYVLFGARYGYRHNPLEAAARLAASRWEQRTPTTG